jgi:hypothetical protein
MRETTAETTVKTRPQPRRLSPIYAARRRLAALRLALRLTAGSLTAQAFTFENRPFGEAHSAIAWLHEQLATLARQDRFLRDILRVLDQNQPPRSWASPDGAKRELLRLAARAKALAALKATASRAQRRR